MNAQSVFVTLINHSQEVVQTRMLIQSLRTFGGMLRNCPVWVFISDDVGATPEDLDGLNVEVYSLEVPSTLGHYWFSRKVLTCAQAESMAPQATQSLIWMAHDCFIIQPPALLQLNEQCDAAFRPVHGTNIGLPVNQPLDYFWQTIYEKVNLSESRITVESYVNQQQIRAYFNSHIFSWNPSVGLGQRWSEKFSELVNNHTFQLKACQDIAHKVFLHQAILSALVESMLPLARLRILPSTYSYPYNMHATIPADRRAHTLNELVCIAYEDRSLHPSEVHDIVIQEPLKGWLEVHLL